MSDEEKGASVVGAAVIERVNVDPHYVDPGGKARRDVCRVVFYVDGISPHGPIEFVGTSINSAGAFHTALEMFLSYLRAKERERAIG